MKISELLFEKSIFKFCAFMYLFITVFFIHKAEGQTQTFYDSLNIAKMQLNQGQIKEALEILDILEKANPGDENVIRVKGQALYWSKDFNLTKSYFQNSIQSYPSLPWIKLDFGRILFELNELNDSEEILKEFLLLQPDNPEALQKLAEINYWTGGKPSTSYSYLNRIFDQYPDNESALKLKKEIHLNTAPRIGVQSTYYSDTQIMEYLGFRAKAEFYHSALLQPDFLAEIRNYQNDASVLIAQVGLKSSLLQSGTDIFLRGGFANSSLWESQELTYGAELNQRLPSRLNFAVSLDREYYLYTLASIAQPINPFTFRSSFGRETGTSLIGKVLYQKSFFEDENWVETIAAWFLIPVIQSSAIQFSLGSSVSFSDSKEVRFSENLPIINQVGNTSIESVIPGSYNPYFTPINQQIIGGLGKLKFDFNPKLSLSLTGNVGLYARIDNPNMIYYGTPPGQGIGQGNRPISQDDVYLVLIDQEYNPFDLNATIDWKVSPKTTLATSYNYQKTIFFNNSQLNLGLKFSLWNE